MVKAVLVERALSAGLTRERRRQLAWLGPTTTATSVSFTLRSYFIEEPEALVDIEIRNHGVLPATVAADDSVLTRVRVDDGVQASTVASAEATEGLGSEASQLVYMEHEIIKIVPLVTSGMAGVSAVHSARKQWPNWCYLLEEDDTLRVTLNGTKVITASDWFETVVSIYTLVAPPRRAI